MAKRITSAAVGVTLAVAVFVAGHFYPMVINVAIAAVCVVAVYEIFTAMGISKQYVIILPSLVFAVIMPLLGGGIVWDFAWYAYTVILFFIMIFMNQVLSFKDIAVIYSMSMLISIALSMIVLVRYLDKDNGIFYVVLTLGLPWTADGGAYFIGSFFGKHKLCPNISPKKTVEGVIGGVIVCVICSLLIGCAFDFWLLPAISVHYGYLALLALLASLVSVIGDLTFSLTKRGCQIKDFGNVIPGHGGVLDRFDSVIFVAPLVSFFVQWLPLI
ncbi:MAG TPA: phosphatidate cytidylyltransferase [Candidatus Gallacutalibacter stercoravium]|nr:phosphatidate cytidylyltransferase [Candidatus Gallacutalibacter stercoravium]